MTLADGGELGGEFGRIAVESALEHHGVSASEVAAPGGGGGGDGFGKEIVGGSGDLGQQEDDGFFR